MILIYVWINAGTDSGSVDSSCLIRHQCAQCTMWSGVPVAGKIDKIVVTQRSGASLVEVGAMEGPEEIVMKYMDARIENRSEDVIALLSDHAENTQHIINNTSTSHTLHFLLYLFIITSFPLTISLTQHTHNTIHTHNTNTTHTTHTT